MSQLPVEKIILDRERQSSVINRFRVSVVYRTDVTRELDRLYGLDGTPLTDGQNRFNDVYRMGYDTVEAERVVPSFIRLASEIGYFCGVRIDEIPHKVIADVEKTTRGRWLQKYEHEDATVVEPSMCLAERAHASS